MFTKEEISLLAFKRYKSNESYEKSVYYLAEMVSKINKNLKNGNKIEPLETDNLVLLLRDDINGALLEPDRETVEDLAEYIYHQRPEKSKLHWYCAEKELLLKEIERLIKDNRERNA